MYSSIKTFLPNILLIADVLIISYLLREIYKIFSNYFQNSNQKRQKISNQDTTPSLVELLQNKPHIDIKPTDPQAAIDSARKLELPQETAFTPTDIFTNSLSSKGISFYENKDILKQSRFLAKTVSIIDFYESAGESTLHSIFALKDKFTITEFCALTKITVVGFDIKANNLSNLLDSIAAKQTQPKTLIVVEQQNQKESKKLINSHKLNVEQFYTNIDVAPNFDPHAYATTTEFCLKLIELKGQYEKIIWLHAGNELVATENVAPMHLKFSTKETLNIEFLT